MLGQISLVPDLPWLMQGLVKQHHRKVAHHSVNFNSNVQGQAKAPGRGDRQSTHKVEGGNGDSQERQGPPNVQMEMAKDKDCVCDVTLSVGAGVMTMTVYSRGN